MIAHQENLLLGRTVTTRTKGRADVFILPLSKHFIVWSARATSNSVVLWRLKARAVQACPVFCTRWNLPTDRSRDSGGQTLLTSLGYLLHSRTCFCQCQTHRCFQSDPLPGRLLLWRQRPHWGTARPWPPEQCGLQSPTSWEGQGVYTIRFKMF